MDDKHEGPLVSIGMPVFNEARFIRESLDALVKQDYGNIELIISDNASEDDTGRICNDYASRHDWIRYHRFDTNTGPASNFAYVLKHSHGKYFMWAAGHDLWSQNYVSECVKLLEPRDSAALAFGTSSWIDEHGETFNRESGWTDTRGMDITARYFTVLWGNMHPILGIMRREFLGKCSLINTVGSDLILLSQLVIQGDFLHAVNAHWSRREFRVEQKYSDKLDRYKSREYGLASSVFSKLFPLARLPVELIKGIWSAELPFTRKLAMLFLLLPTLPVKYLSGRH